MTMASIIGFTSPSSYIEYSAWSGHVRVFELEGVTLYDETDGTETDGWREKLVEFVREHHLDVDPDGHGLHAFVYPLLRSGRLPVDTKGE
jgi:hypothetical protein